MIHTLLLGILIGWGVAIPIGPVNLEITRRNLNYGFRYGIAIGLGATSADLTYIILLISGALIVLTHPDVLRTISILGSLVLFWFGWKAMTTKLVGRDKSSKQASLGKCFALGYSMAFLSPYNILFWASLTSQIANIALHYPNAIYSMSAGVLLGTLSWLMGLNIGLHITRHKISPQVIHKLNLSGGLILWAFASYGLLHAVV